MSRADFLLLIKNYHNWTTWTLRAQLIVLLIGYSILVMGELRFGIWPTIQEKRQLHTQVEQLNQAIQTMQQQIEQVQLKNKKHSTHKKSSTERRAEPALTQIQLLQALVTSTQAHGVQILKIKPEQPAGDPLDQHRVIQVSVRAPTFILFKWADHFFNTFPVLLQHVLFLTEVDPAQLESQRVIRVEFLVQWKPHNESD